MDFLKCSILRTNALWENVAVILFLLVYALSEGLNPPVPQDLFEASKKSFLIFFFFSCDLIRAMISTLPAHRNYSDLEKN